MYVTFSSTQSLTAYMLFADLVGRVRQSERQSRTARNSIERRCSTSQMPHSNIACIGLES